MLIFIHIHWLSYHWRCQFALSAVPHAVDSTTWFALLPWQQKLTYTQSSLNISNRLSIKLYSTVCVCIQPYFSIVFLNLYLLVATAAEINMLSPHHIRQITNQTPINCIFHPFISTALNCISKLYFLLAAAVKINIWNPQHIPQLVNQNSQNWRYCQYGIESASDNL